MRTVRSTDTNSDYLLSLYDTCFIALHGDIELKYIELKSSLLLNKAAVCNRLAQWKETIKCTSEVITRYNRRSSSGISSESMTCIKACLRRSVAHFSMHDILSMKKDLKRVLELDPKNKDALKELRKLKVYLADEKKRAKSTFGNIFRNNVNIYDDKEAEMKQRTLRLKKEEEERKNKYEAEMVKAVEAGGKRISFKEWEEQKTQEENEKKRVEEKKRKERELERQEKRKQEELERRQKLLREGKDPGTLFPCFKARFFSLCIGYLIVV